MKKGLVVSLFLFAIILLSLTFISASWFSDLFGPQGFTGKVTAGICGNGILEAGELCDGEDPLGDITSCVDFGFASGTLSCTSCRFDTSRCVAKPTAAVCGNGIVESVVIIVLHNVKQLVFKDHIVAMEFATAVKALRLV